MLKRLVGRGGSREPAAAGSGGAKEGTPPPEAEAAPPGEAEAGSEPAGATAAAADHTDESETAAATARAQAEGQIAVAVRGHPSRYYNAVFRRSEQPVDGWPQYALELADGDRLYLFRHAASGRWVFSFTAEDDDLEGPAAILAPEGPVPLGEHTWRRRGEDVRLTVTALATEAEAAEFIEQQRAEAEAVEQAACAAAREQLANVVAVTIEGMPTAAYNSVYLPAGEHDGWLCFESTEGKHLFRCVRDSEWYLLDKFDPNSESPAAYVEAEDGVLPVGEQEWTGLDADEDLLLTVTLLTTPAEAETAAGRLREAQERQLADEKAEKEAACCSAREQLADVAGIVIEGMPDAKYNSVYLPAGEHEGWLRFESAACTHLFRCVRDSEWYLMATFDPHSDAPAAYVEANDGLLPVGEQEWIYLADDEELPLPLVVSLLITEAEVKAVVDLLFETTERQLIELIAATEAEEQKLTEFLAATEAAEQAVCDAAKAQLAGVAGVAIDGMPDAEFNSVYLPVGEHEGWVRFASAAGKHLYRQQERQLWALRDTFDPAATGAAAYVYADGLVPAGEHQWTVGGKDLPLAVSLLAVGAVEVTEAEQRVEEREAEWRERQKVLEAIAQAKTGHLAKLLFADAPGALRDDKEVALAVIERNGGALKHASVTLQGDKEVALAAVRQDGYALEYSSTMLQDDKEVVLAAVNGYAQGGALKHASAALRDDKEVVITAVENCGWALEHASVALQDDKQVVLAAVANAVKNDPEALRHASEWLQDDTQFVRVANALFVAAPLPLDREMQAAVFETLYASAQAAGAGECGGLLPLLCDPDPHIQAVGALMVAQACATGSVEQHGSAPGADADAAATVLRILLQLLSSGASAARQHAAQALAHAMRDPVLKDQIVDEINKSADAKDLLAVLADSSNVELAQQAEHLLESAEPGAGKGKGKRRAELRASGLAVLFGRQKQLGWRELPAEEYIYLQDKRIFVEGYGPGWVRYINSSKLSSRLETYNVVFDDESLNVDPGSCKKVKLRSKGNGHTRWLLAPEKESDDVVWKTRGGQRLDLNRPRDARVNDVCLWMHEQGGLVRLYAGLFGWIQLADGSSSGVVGINGEQLLRLNDETLRDKLYIQLEEHRQALLAAIASLAGLLGRYRIAEGPPIHRSRVSIATIHM